MIFTIREYGANTVTVDYEDGSWAVVPLSDIDITNKALVAARIKEYAPQLLAEPIEVPDFEVGDVVDTSRVEYQLPPELDPASIEQVDWAQARRNLYPTAGEQLDALYWARKGDCCMQEMIDKRIERVKTIVPKTWQTRSRAEYVQWLMAIE